MLIDCFKKCEDQDQIRTVVTGKIKVRLLRDLNIIKRERVKRPIPFR